MKNYVTAALVCACTMGLIGILSGCAQEQTPEPIVQEEQKAPEYQVIGKETEGSYGAVLTNNLPGDVAALSIKPADKDEFPISMLGSGEKLAAGDTAQLYYAPEADVATDATYDMLITASDGTTYTLHSIDLAHIHEATLEYGDEVAYLSYANTDGKKGDTKQAELDVMAAEKAAAEAAAAEKAAAEAAAAEAAAAEAAAAEAAAAEAAAQEPVYQEPVYQEPYYEEPVYTAPSGGGDAGSSNSGSGDSGSSAPAQSEDQCVEGGVLLR